MFAVSRPAGYNQFYLKESELASRYRLVSKNRAKDWWLEEQSKIPPTEQKTIHLLSGALLPIWKYLKKLQQTGLSIVRTTADDGTRLVGLNIGANVIGEIRRTFGLWKNSAQTAEEIIKCVREENEIVELLGDMKIRSTRFQGNRVVEITPTTYEQIRELRETGLINIIQNSKQRFFIPEDETAAHESLSKVLNMFPPLHLLKSDEKAVYEPNITLSNDTHTPVRLPEWLIEPNVEEIERIIVRN